MTKRLHIWEQRGKGRYDRLSMCVPIKIGFFYCYYFVTFPQINVLFKHLLVLNLHQLN